MLLSHEDGPSTIEGLRSTLCVNVSGAVVLATTEKHAGMMAGQLPELAVEAEAGDTSTDDDTEGE